MTTIIAYRYDNHRYEVGDIITSRGDSFDSLTPIEKKVEPVLRDIAAARCSPGKTKP